ncbi:hypothetical protein HMPREF3293_03164 [Christensenella minuta]|uniref:Uncharacterized protein n=1 Tax=Christensenella minuta TaxID=626937 RepID=A0A136Q0Z3_9FIRM|nr:hypothetical protein HMPREF3293_03164 [Christensenella minuta]
MVSPGSGCFLVSKNISYTFVKKEQTENTGRKAFLERRIKLLQ